MTTCGGPRSWPGPGQRPTASGPGSSEPRPRSGGPESLVTSIWSWITGAVASRNDGLRGKRALVSGCGGGLGRELSLQLVRQGCKVVCVDQDALQVQETLGLLQLQMVQDAASRGRRRGRGPRDRDGATDSDVDGVLSADVVDVSDVARGYACDWRNPGEALGLSRAVVSAEGGVDLIFIVPESNNNNASAVDSAGKIIGNEFWPLLGFLPGMLARAKGHVVHVLDEQIAHKTGAVADAWIESLHEVGADVRYTKVHLHSDQTRHRPCRSEAAAHSIVSAVRRGSSEVHIAYPLC